MFCFPDLTPLFDSVSAPSTITAAGIPDAWPGTEGNFDSGISSYSGIYKASDDYHITDYSGLKAMSDYAALYEYDDGLPNRGGSCFASQTFLLDNDIDCSGYSFVPIQFFNGTFNGQGHSICNLSCDQTISSVGVEDEESMLSGDFVSVFIAMVTSGMTLSNVNFLNFKTSEEIFSGLIYGNSNYNLQNEKGCTIRISNVYVESNSEEAILPCGFVINGSYSQVTIMACTIIEHRTDLYQILTTPTVMGGAFVAETKGATIQIMFSSAIGGQLWMVNDTEEYIITGPESLTIQNSFLIGYDPDGAGGSSFEIDELGYRKVIYNWDEPSAQLYWTYYNNINYGIPFITLKTWITPNPNSLASSSIKAHLINDLGCFETTKKY